VDSRLLQVNMVQSNSIGKTKKLRKFL
jgi:hypothetical protein